MSLARTKHIHIQFDRRNCFFAIVQQNRAGIVFTPSVMCRDQGVWSRAQFSVPAILRSAGHSTDINMEETRRSNQPWSVSVCRSLLCININTSATLFPDQKFGLLFALENWMLSVDMMPRPILLYNRSPIFPVLAGS